MNLINKILIFGIVLEITLLAFFDKEMAVYGPLMFWLIGVFVLIQNINNIYKLSNSVKKTKPEIFKKYHFGVLLKKHAFNDNNFLKTLNTFEKELLKENKSILRYFIFCIVLFIISIFLISLK